MWPFSSGQLLLRKEWRLWTQVCWFGKRAVQVWMSQQLPAQKRRKTLWMWDHMHITLSLTYVFTVVILWRLCEHLSVCLCVCVILSVKDPCKEHNGGCPHICSNVNGQVQCSCRPGFKLAADFRRCEGLCTQTYPHAQTFFFFYR